MMEKALVAVFEDRTQAQQAHDALVAEGFSNGNVRLASAQDMETTSSTSEREGYDESFGQKIASFFGFGKGDATDTYSEAVRRGNCVLSIDVANDEEATRAADIMERHDPVDIDERAAQWRASGWQGSQAGTQANGGEAIPIVEEQLRVGKREVRRGGVRVRSHNYEKPVEANVQLHEERGIVERRTVDRAATDDDVAFGEVSFEVQDTAEEAVVAKEARVVEEVVVGKEASDRTETISDSVRRTDVDVEDLTDQDPNTARKSDAKSTR
jgi:uncharacterized protein (TIGR02271 family)